MLFIFKKAFILVFDRGVYLNLSLISMLLFSLGFGKLTFQLELSEAKNRLLLSTFFFTPSKSENSSLDK